MCIWICHALSFQHDQPRSWRFNGLISMTPTQCLDSPLWLVKIRPYSALSLHVFLVEPLIFDLKNEVKPPFLHISTGSTWFYPPSAHPVQRRQATAPGVVWRRRRCAGRGETERHGSSDARPVGWVL